MNETLKDVIMIASGMIGITLFILIRNLIISKAKTKIIKIIPEEEKAKVKDLYEKGFIPEKIYNEVCLTPQPTECFDTKKFLKSLVNIINPVLWAKELAWLFNLRKLLLVAVVVAVIFGYGKYQGKKEVSPILDWHGKEEWVSLNEHYLHVKTDGSMEILDSDKKTILKKLTVKDFENLKKNSRPYGFIFEPVLVAGLGASSVDAGIEAGVGARWFKWYKWNTDIAITNKGIYPLGISYRLTDNTAVGLSVGTGFKKGERGLFERFLLKFSIKF